MREWADFSLEGGDGAATLALKGSLRVHFLGDLDRRLAEIDQPVERIDLSQVREMDTAGAWLAWRVAHDHDATITGASGEAERMIAAVGQAIGTEEEPVAERPPLLDRVNEWIRVRVLKYADGLYQVVGFLGSTFISFGDVIRHPSRFRMKAFVHQVEQVGVTSLGIVGLMSFLIGIVIAQQGAVQLQQFGAEIYTINLTGRLAMRELGILMTAIMVAGRSGSAFAAQIGTMQLTEEVDAMRTIGVSPMEALVVPRVLATMIMMPLLGFYASILAIVGGAVTSIFALGIPFFSFINRIQEVVPLHDVWIGVVKGPVFGLIIAVAGCYHGMQVKGDAEQVGRRTTQAVVAAIFMVIVLDAFFAVFFTEIGWE
jgi:phospholipid/cholesterol/gamma-HCH transport system permease protein